MLPISLRGLDFTTEEMLGANRRNEIFLVNMHVNGPKCNLKCPYCLVGEGTHLIDHTEQKEENNRPVASVSDMQKWITEAKHLGGRTIIIDGLYEPLMNESMTLEIIEYVDSCGMVPILVTNALLMTKKIAKRLFRVNASVFTKLNTPLVDKNDLNYEEYVKIQQYLTGVKNYNVYEGFRESIQLLINEGFSMVKSNQKGLLATRLGVETVIAPENYHCIPKLIEQMRKLNIYVHAETIKPQGSAKDISKFWIEPTDIRDLFQTIKKDDEKFGITTSAVSPPLAGGKCLRHLGSFSITVNGDVIPCPSIELVLGNLYHTTLKEIINSNPDVNIIRNLPEYIQGDCRECNLLKTADCYGGCRGYTYMALKQESNNHHDALTASDPYCWHVKRVLDT